MHPVFAADLFEAGEFGERIGVVVDPQVERRPLVFAVNQKRGRLLAALVAAGGFAGSHRRDQALRERQVLLGDKRRAVSSSTRAPASMLPAIEKPLPSMCPHQSTHSRPGMGGDAAGGIHDVKLPAVAAVIGGDQGFDDVARARPWRSSFRPSMP